MSKRSNDSPDGSEDFDEEYGSKRKRITFDSIRLPAVSNVNDIDGKVAVVQAVKLSQQLRYRNRKYEELSQENQRLKQRQETDENSCYIINRQVLEMESQIRSALRSETDVELPNDEEFPGVSEVIPDQKRIEEEYGRVTQRAVQFCHKLVSHRQKKSEKQKLLIRKWNEFTNNPSSSTLCDEATRQMTSHAAEVAEENTKLVVENGRLQKELSAARLKLRQKEDECVLMLSKKEELQEGLKDAKFDADKWHRLANKFECRLHDNISKFMMEQTPGLNATASSSSSVLRRANGQNNGSPTVSVDNKDLETLKTEKEEQTELANKRGQEIADLNAKIQKMSAELAKLKQMEGYISSDVITRSEEYKNLQKYYCLAVKEYERVSKELEEVVRERDHLRSQFDERIEAMKKEHELSLKKMSEVGEEVNQSNCQLRRDYDTLRMEFQQSHEQHKHAIDEAKQTDIKAIFGQMKQQNFVLKQEVTKYKKKWRDATSLFSQKQRESEGLRKKIDYSVVIPLSDDASEMAGDVDICGGQTRSHQLTSPEPTSKDEDEGNGNNIKEDVAQRHKDRADIARLRKENDLLTKEIKKLGAVDRTERLKFFEKEVQIHIAQKLAEIEQLKKDAEEHEKWAKTMNEEVETIGQALEELQEQNGMLIAQKRDMDDNNMKLMNDRIASAQVLQKERERNSQMGILHKKELQQVQSMELELQSLKATSELQRKALELKSAEVTKLTICVENNRKLLQELGLAKDDLMIRNEKVESQLKQIQDVLGSRTSQIESLQQKRKRLEEENAVLRKKLERAQKTEKLGSADAVLNEEVRQLKELLTCPSCKVHRKDAIIDKCNHVFCLDCLKKRYDTRQRKCPRCNQGFGANDFHRIFFT